jgi:mRNA-degrading endonuclease RelE of RelBE toxin-antitoxin system
MNYEVRFRPEAEKDVEDAAKWYENQRPGLGKEFLDKCPALWRILQGSLPCIPLFTGTYAGR